MKASYKENIFGYFSFYYGIIGNRLFITVLLSIMVGLLDGLGLTMLIPLLQAVEKGVNSSKESLGQLHYLISLMESVGFALTLNSILAVFVLMFILKGVVKFVEQIYFVKIQLLFMKKTQYNLLKNFQEISYNGYLQLDAGKIQNTFISEVYRMSLAMKNFFKWSQSFLMLITYIFLAFLANFQFAFLVVLSAGLTNLFYTRIHRKIKAASLEISKKGHNLNAYMIEVVHYFKYLKSTDYLQRFSEKIKEVIKQTQSINKKTGIYSALLTGLREPIVVCIVVLVIFIQINWIGGNLGSIILSLLLFYRGLNVLMTIQSEWQGFLNNHGSMRTVFEVSDTMSTMKEVQGTRTFTSFEKEILLVNITISYTDTPVLSDVNIRLPKNKTIAFVGISGSGKTTLVNIISGLLKPNKGSLLIDGTPLNSYNLNTYRSKVGYISQESVVFNDTIYNNVTFWSVPSPENMKRFWEVIQLASLENFVQGQPKKEHTPLGDNGILISGGQRQRISIARELYKKPEILLLDEATSALDSETELIIQENIEKLQGSYTMIIIAHRLSTIKNADVIYLLEKGEIICYGDFETMVKKSNKFKHMVSLQGMM